MDLFRQPLFRVFCALFAFFVITGDIVADAIHEATGACATESQDSDCDTCPACSCTIHNGAAVAPDAAALLGPVSATAKSMTITDDRPALGAATAIDHPPQLA